MTSSFVLIVLSMAVYGGLHSLLASERVKEWVCRRAGPAAMRGYRLAFNLVGGLTFLPVLALAAWLPDAPLYRVPFPLWLLFAGVQVLGLALLAAGLRQTGAARFLGLAQLFGSGPARPPRLVTGGVYRWMRHPLYAGGLLALWFLPVMTWNLLALAVGVTAYMYIGARFEERRLLRQFGPAYGEYLRRTPMFLPLALFAGQRAD